MVADRLSSLKKQTNKKTTKNPKHTKTNKQKTPPLKKTKTHDKNTSPVQQLEKCIICMLPSLHRWSLKLLTEAEADHDQRSQNSFMIPFCGLYRCDRGTKAICTKAKAYIQPTSSHRLDHLTSEYQAAHSFKLLWGNTSIFNVPLVWISIWSPAWRTLAGPDFPYHLQLISLAWNNTQDYQNQDALNVLISQLTFVCQP